MQFPKTFHSLKRMQETNRTTILRAFFANAPISRSEIAKQTGLSLPTVSRLVKDLLQEKVLVTAGKLELMQGRNRELLELNYNYIHILGFEVSEDFVHGVVCNLRGDVKKSISKPVSNKKAAYIGESIKDVIDEIYLEKAKLGRIIGVGLSVSGIVSPTKQRIIYSGTMGWHDIHISDLFPPLEGLTVVVENDANAAILGELWLKNISDQQDAVYIIIGGSAIGASLLINGELVRGSDLVAGEISHFPVAQNGKKCACGKRGCFETYVSLGRLQKDYEELSGRSTDLIEAYKNGDKTAVKLVVEAAEKLGKVILSIMYLVNPEKIIIGGLWLEAGDEFLQLVRNTVKSEFSLAAGLIPEIAYSGLHPRAGVLGAVGLVINEFLSYQ